MFWVIISTIVASFIALTAITVRMKASEKPTSKRRIILPPLFMSTGAFMFFFPVFQVELAQAVKAIGVGAIFSLFLIRTSRLEMNNGKIYLLSSKSFIFILLGLLLLRIIGKLIIGSKIAVGETSGLFYLVGFGMIFTWRLVMLYKYDRLKKYLYSRR